MTWAVREKGYSQRRACGLVGLHPKTYRYASTRPDDERLRIKLKDLASQRRRFGYRRLGLLLARQGIRLDHKKLYRLYKEEGLTLRKRGGRKRALGTGRRWRTAGSEPALVTRLPSMDTLVIGRRFRILTLVDDCSVTSTEIKKYQGGASDHRSMEDRLQPRIRTPICLCH